MGLWGDVGQRGTVCTVRVGARNRLLAALAAPALFGYLLAVAKGLDPDAPRDLRKVTRTR
jgi:fructoselysine-6-P-deglycase FrlB-like protein